LSQYNPKLIYALCTGFGTQGPDKDLPAGEIIGNARGGGMLMQRPEGAPPIYSAMGLGDRAAGLYLSHAILAALLARERLGIGQQVTVSLLSGIMNIFGQSVICPLMTDQEYEPFVREKVRNPLYNFYKCKDGCWIVIALVQRPWTWPAFCRALGSPDLEHNPKFDTAEKREKNNEELINVLDQIFSTKTYDEWDKYFREEDGLVFSKVNRMSDLASDPQVVANNYITEWDHPVLGSIKFLGFPVQYSKTPCLFRTAAPEVGQHSEEILIDLLGYTWNDIARFKDDEAI
jgi:crotonobetainyl-CoA:carnitine CoA-transferase CaiB-like acyl-CoA transferase